MGICSRVTYECHLRTRERRQVYGHVMVSTKPADNPGIQIRCQKWSYGQLVHSAIEFCICGDLATVTVIGLIQNRHPRERLTIHAV